MKKLYIGISLMFFCSVCFFSLSAKSKPIRIAVYEDHSKRETTPFYEELYQLIIRTIRADKKFALVPGEDLGDEQANPFRLPKCFMESSETCGADVYMLILPDSRDGDQASVILSGIETGKSIITTIDDLKELSTSETKRYKKKVKQTIVEGLNYAGHLCEVLADEIIDIPNSKVKYNIATTTDQTLGIIFDYTSVREDKDSGLQNVSFVDTNIPSKEEKTYEIPTKEGLLISIAFRNQGKEFRVLPLYTPTIPDEERILTVVSQANYEINLTCIWKDGKFSGSNVKPKIWPYTVEISSQSWRVY